MKVLSFDPSGNYSETEGMGTTGYAISLDWHMPHKLEDIKAKDFNSKHAYWNIHKQLILTSNPDIVVIESYRLFGHKAKEQSGSSLQTAQLIGYLEMVCYEAGIPVVLQDPSIKTRFKDEVLLKSNVIEKRGSIKMYYRGELTNMHKRDALRHNLYFCKYGRKKLATNN